MASLRGGVSMWWDRQNPKPPGEAETNSPIAAESARPARSTLPPPALSPLPPAPAKSSIPSAGADPRVVTGSFIVDGTGTLLAFDRNMERMTGWNAFEIVGQPKDIGFYDLPDEHGQRRYRALPLYEGRLPRVTQSTPITLLIHRKDGTRLEVEAVVSPLGFQGHRYQVEIKRVLSRVPGPLHTGHGDGFDTLTGLPGAETFRERLREAFQTARQSGRPLSVLLIEIDRNQDLLRSGTQDISDEAVRRVAGVLQASVRMADPAGRVGQHTFAVALEGTGRGDARAVGGRIRAMVERFSFGHRVDGNEIKATVSIGIGCYPADGENPLELLRRADDALKEAHRLGRNRVWCYVRRQRVAVSTEVYFDGPEGQMLGMSRDLSNSGLFVETHDQLPEGMRLGLRFGLPGTPDEIHVVGRVSRRVVAGGVSGSAINGLGIEFERYSDADRWRLESYLHQITGGAFSETTDR